MTDQTDQNPQTPPQPSTAAERVYGLLPDGTFVSFGTAPTPDGRHALADNLDGVRFAQAVAASAANKPVPLTEGGQQ